MKHSAPAVSMLARAIRERQAVPGMEGKVQL